MVVQWYAVLLDEWNDVLQKEQYNQAKKGVFVDYSVYNTVVCTLKDDGALPNISEVKYNPGAMRCASPTFLETEYPSGNPTNTAVLNPNISKRY